MTATPTGDAKRRARLRAIVRGYGRELLHAVPHLVGQVVPCCTSPACPRCAGAGQLTIGRRCLPSLYAALAVIVDACAQLSTTQGALHVVVPISHPFMEGIAVSTCGGSLCRRTIGTTLAQLAHLGLIHYMHGRNRHCSVVALPGMHQRHREQSTKTIRAELAAREPKPNRQSWTRPIYQLLLDDVEAGPGAVVYLDDLKAAYEAQRDERAQAKAGAIVARVQARAQREATHAAAAAAARAAELERGQLAATGAAAQLAQLAAARRKADQAQAAAAAVTPAGTLAPAPARVLKLWAAEMSSNSKPAPHCSATPAESHRATNEVETDPVYYVNGMRPQTAAPARPPAYGGKTSTPPTLARAPATAPTPSQGRRQSAADDAEAKSPQTGPAAGGGSRGFFAHPEFARAWYQANEDAKREGEAIENARKERAKHDALERQRIGSLAHVLKIGAPGTPTPFRPARPAGPPDLDHERRKAPHPTPPDPSNSRY